MTHTDDTNPLPATCYGALAGDLGADSLILIRRNTTGYWPAEGYSKGAFATWSEVADLLNARRGISKAQRAAMEAGSMFGFDTAAADPDRYDDQGKFANGKAAL